MRDIPMPKQYVVLAVFLMLYGIGMLAILGLNYHDESRVVLIATVATVLGLPTAGLFTLLVLVAEKGRPGAGSSEQVTGGSCGRAVVVVSTSGGGVVVDAAPGRLNISVEGGGEDPRRHGHAAGLLPRP